MNLKNLSDEQLVSLYIDNQSNLYFEQLYDRYADKIYRKCLSFVKEEAKAEDYTHDIFMKLVLNIASFKETAKFSTWLYAITYNYCIDQTRITKRFAENPIEEHFDVVEDDDETELAEMEANRLRKALQQIVPEDKTILMMKYQDEMSIKEISGNLDISESAVKMRLLRAKDKRKKAYLESLFFWGVIITKAIHVFFNHEQ